MRVVRVRVRVVRVWCGTVRSPLQGLLFKGTPFDAGIGTPFDAGIGRGLEYLGKGGWSAWTPFELRVLKGTWFGCTKGFVAVVIRAAGSYGV